MVKNTDNNHDGAYKKIFSHPEMVESLIRDFVPEDWVLELDFSTLKNVNKSFITDEIRSRADDIIWKVRWNDSWVYVYLIIEFQSSVDKWMAVRTMVLSIQSVSRSTFLYVEPLRSGYEGCSLDV